mmetsp:Transcript_17598/g.40178  ORF Transcript_17598/g.40178 Transcript_17598/m.40178 type:complete len:140 (-) Transcript_17598:3421-3840(-)
MSIDSDSFTRDTAFKMREKASVICICICICLFCFVCYNNTIFSDFGSSLLFASASGMVQVSVPILLLFKQSFEFSAELAPSTLHQCAFCSCPFSCQWNVMPHGGPSRIIRIHENPRISSLMYAYIYMCVLKSFQKTHGS